MRHGMWEKVAARSHKPAQIYAFSKSSDDVMLHGTVDYELKDGKKAEGIEWAARAHFSPLGGQPKMDFYQVYLVRRSVTASCCSWTNANVCRTRLPWLRRPSNVLQQLGKSTCIWQSAIVDLAVTIWQGTMVYSIMNSPEAEQFPLLFHCCNKDQPIGSAVRARYRYNEGR